MSTRPDDQGLRLGLHGFAEDEAHAIKSMVAACRSAWTAADATPLHALLLARGTRVGDPENLAVLRVRIDPRRVRRDFGERRMQPLMLRKPIREAALRVALDAARTRLLRYGEPAPAVPPAVPKKAA
jgi:hypothetical protein